MQITEDGIRTFTDEECLAPLSDTLDITDCCSLKKPVFHTLLNIIAIKLTVSILISETREIPKGNELIFYFKTVCAVIFSSFIKLKKDDFDKFRASLKEKQRKIFDNSVTFRENETLNGHQV